MRPSHTQPVMYKENVELTTSTPFQIYQPKTQDTQTTRVKGTSVPKPSVFIAGLRGCKSETTEAYKVDLTLDVDTHNDICD